MWDNSEEPALLPAPFGDAEALATTVSQFGGFFSLLLHPLPPTPTGMAPKSTIQETSASKLPSQSLFSGKLT